MIYDRWDHTLSRIRSKIYAFGGINGKSKLVTSTCEIHDLITNTWKELPEMPFDIAPATSTVALDKILITGNGCDRIL